MEGVCKVCFNKLGIKIIANSPENWKTEQFGGNHFSSQGGQYKL